MVAGVPVVLDRGAWKGDVGRAVDGNGKPYDRETLMEVAELSPKKFDELMEACAETDHIDREAWEQRGELFFPGAMERASEYTRKKVRRSGADSPSPPAGDSPDTDRILTGHSPETDGDCPTGTSDHAEDCPARSDQIREEEIRSDQIRREKRTRAPTSPASPRLRPPSKSLSKRWRTGTS